MLFVLTFVVNAAARAIVNRRKEFVMTATTAARTRPTFAKASGRAPVQERTRDASWSTRCFLIALIPLVWVLWTVVSKGSAPC